MEEPCPGEGNEEDEEEEDEGGREGGEGGKRGKRVDPKVEKSIITRW